MIVFILIDVVGVAATVAMALYGGTTDRRRGRRLVACTVIAFGVALAVTAYLAHRGVYATTGGRVPWIGIAIAAGLLGCLAATRIPAVAAALSDPDAPARLAVPQAFRVIGATFLVAWAAQGHLPALFALPAGLGDVAVGLSALFVARSLRRDPGARRGALWFNVLGIVDLVVAIGIGFLAAAGPYQLVHVHPSTAAVAALPLAIIPTLLVPVAAALHILSIRRLRRPAADATWRRAGSMSRDGREQRPEDTWAPGAAETSTATPPPTTSRS